MQTFRKQEEGLIHNSLYEVIITHILKPKSIQEKKLQANLGMLPAGKCEVCMLRTMIYILFTHIYISNQQTNVK